MQKITYGSSPWGEDAAQTAHADYSVRGPAECEAFKRQLIRHFEANGSRLPSGVRIRIMSNPHDFGTYYEVAAIVDDDNDKTALDAAYWLDANTPEFWDDEARKELGLGPSDVI